MSRSENVTVDDVDRDARDAELVYDVVLDCFGRKWRMVIKGDYHDYTGNNPLRPYMVVSIVVGVAIFLLLNASLGIIWQHHLRERVNDSNISKLEVESQNLRLMIETGNAERKAMESEVELSKARSVQL